MKIAVFLFAAFFAFAACKNDASPKTAEELQKIKAELELKKKELADKQAISDIEKELSDVEKQIKQVDKAGRTETTEQKPSGAATETAVAAPTAGGGSGTRLSATQGTIKGTGVSMRSDATIKSDKISTFNAGEKVIVLENRNVNNDNEAILTKPIALTVSQTGVGDAAITLPKGKAVVIESYNADDNKYAVSYQDAKNGKLFAQVGSDAIETITYATWYKVKRSNGQTGWVLGKFLNN